MRLISIMPSSASPTWPKKYSRTEAPPEVVDLAARLMPLLLAGDDPTRGFLRAQYERATIRQVELSGVGFFVEYEVPIDVKRTIPARLAGGNVNIQIKGVEHGAGCVLFVTDGALSLLEVYTHGGEEWPEHPVVAELTDPRPIGA